MESGAGMVGIKGDVSYRHEHDLSRINEAIGVAWYSNVTSQDGPVNVSLIRPDTT